MSVIEFQTRIEHGTVEIPEEYRHRMKGYARIMIILIGEVRTSRNRNEPERSFVVHHRSP